MSDRRPTTILDVAAAAGVSKSLVSMVLRGDPGVSEARRTRVLEAVAAIGYRPNRAAAILAGNRTHTIGVVLDDYRNTWYVPMLGGVQAALAPHGMRVTVTDTTLNAHLHLDPLDDLVSLRVDGIVIAMEPPEGMATPEGVPVVVTGERSVTVPGADVVAVDERVGGGLATTHLIELGHVDIGHCTGSGGAAAARRDAHVETMVRAGLTPNVVGNGGTTERDGYEAAATLLDARPELTALYAANDVMAMGAIAAARDRGRRVPDDLSIIGHDDSPLAASPLLRLTSVDTRNAEVGGLAAGMLLDRLGGSGAPAPPQRVLVEPRLTVRSSTRPNG